MLLQLNKMKDLIIYLRKITYITLFIVHKIFRLKEPDYIILCYHGIGEGKWNFDITIDNFKKQINYLKNHYNNNFLITFDDGYHDLYKYKDEISKLGIKPFLFVLTDPNKVNRKELNNNKKLLSAKEILELIKMGWEIGLHSATHPDLSKLSERQLTNEIFKAKLRLERNINKKVNYFAYPKGKYNNLVIKLVKDAKFKKAYSMDDKVLNKTNSRFTIPRVGVMRNHDFIEFKSMFLPISIKFRGLVVKYTGITLS